MHTDTLATAAVARLERADGDGRGWTRLRWANAGHPPPLVLGPDGDGDRARRAHRRPHAGRRPRRGARRVGDHPAARGRRPPLQRRAGRAPRQHHRRGDRPAGRAPPRARGPAARRPLRRAAAADAARHPGGRRRPGRGADRPAGRDPRGADARRRQNSGPRRLGARPHGHPVPCPTHRDPEGGGHGSTHLAADGRCRMAAETSGGGTSPSSPSCRRRGRACATGSTASASRADPEDTAARATRPRLRRAGVQRAAPRRGARSSRRSWPAAAAG